MKYLIIDLETTCNKEHDRVGNFYYGKILAISLRNEAEQRTQYVNGGLKDLEIDEDILVGHNIKYDLLYLWGFKGVQDFLTKGGKIYDTALAEYLISGQTNKYPKLRDIAVQKYGCPDRIKHIDRLLFNKKETILGLTQEFEHETDPTKKWAIREDLKHIMSYNKMEDLPRASVLKDVEEDVKDTEQVYLRQLEYIKKHKMEPLIYITMNSLLATTEMEYNGFRIDQDVMNRNMFLRQADLKDVEDKLQELIKRYWK